MYERNVGHPVVRRRSQARTRSTAGLSSKLNRDQDVTSPRTLANHEVVVLATYLAGGRTAYTDTEDIAVKANEIAPGRFTWRKYKEQSCVHWLCPVSLGLAVGNPPDLYSA